MNSATLRHYNLAEQCHTQTFYKRKAGVGETKIPILESTYEDPLYDLKFQSIVLVYYHFVTELFQQVTVLTLLYIASLSVMVADPFSLTNSACHHITCHPHNHREEHCTAHSNYKVDYVYLVCLPSSRG